MAIIVIASFLILIQLLNYWAREENDKKLNNLENTNISENSNANINNYSDAKITSNVSGVTGESISEEEIKDTQNVLDEFFDYCNNNKLEEAYNMLTDECKELIYPTLQIFEDNYYKNIFNGNSKSYSFENWNKDTYLVTIQEDALALGKLPSESDKKIDYVTLVDQKLNISSYIGRTKINKETISDGIKFVVNSKDTYMDYESYNISVTNNTGKTVCLGEISSSKNICIQDSNNIKYGFYNTEILQNQLIVRNDFTINVNLKFFSSYVSSKKIEYLSFENVLLDYDNNKENTTRVYVEI
jgi:hypothetical protein